MRQLIFKEEAIQRIVELVINLANEENSVDSDGGVVPSALAVELTARQGTLNFYDDPTHIYLPDFKAVIKRLVRDNGMYIEFASKSYKPFLAWLRGMIQNCFNKHSASGCIWYYYGFVSVIIAHKK